MHTRCMVSFGALQGTRTPDLLVRSQLLYPAELAAHTRFSQASLYIITYCLAKSKPFFKFF